VSSKRKSRTAANASSTPSPSTSPPTPGEHSPLVMTVATLMSALNESGGSGGTLQRATSANSIRKEAHARAALLNSKREKIRCWKYSERERGKKKKFFFPHTHCEESNSHPDPFADDTNNNNNNNNNVDDDDGILKLRGSSPAPNGGDALTQSASTRSKTHGRRRFFSSGGLEGVPLVRSGSAVAVNLFRTSREGLRHSASSPRGPPPPSSPQLANALAASKAAAAERDSSGKAPAVSSSSSSRGSHRAHLSRRIEQLKRELREKAKEIRELRVKAVLWDQHKRTCAVAASAVEPSPDDISSSDATLTSEEAPQHKTHSSSSNNNNATSTAATSTSSKSARQMADIYASPRRVAVHVQGHASSPSSRRIKSSKHVSGSPKRQGDEPQQQHSSSSTSLTAAAAASSSSTREPGGKNVLRRRRYSGLPGMGLGTSPPTNVLSMSPLGPGIALKTQSPISSPRSSLTTSPRTSFTTSPRTSLSASSPRGSFSASGHVKRSSSSSIAVDGATAATAGATTDAK
jgi:hypothetical protein